MSKSKKPTKISDVKETSARSINSEKLGSHGLGDANDNSPNKNLKTPFSFVTDEVKEKIGSFMRASIGLIEFQRKNFEINYKNAIKIYDDLFYDVKALTNKNLKGIKT